MRKIASLQNSFQANSTPPTSVQHCTSRQVLLELDRNEELKLQLFRAYQTIKNLREQASSQSLIETKRRVETFRDAEEISFRQQNFSVNEEISLTSEIWRDNYHKLTQYIGAYLQDAKFLAQKCLSLQQKCSKYQKEQAQQEQKQIKQSSQQKQLLIEMEEKMKENQQIILTILKENQVHEVKIKEREFVIDQKNYEIDSLNKKFDEYFQETQKEIKILFKKVSQKQEQLNYYESRIEQFQRERQRYEEQIKNKTKILVKFEEQTKNKEKTIYKYKEQLKKKQTDFDLIQQQLKSRKIAEQRLQEDSRNNERMLQIRLEEALIQIRQKQKESELYISSVESQKISYEDIIASLKKTIEIQERQFNKQIRNIVEQKTEKVNKIKQLKGSLINAECELTELRSMIEDLNIRVNQKEWQIDELNSIRELENRKYQQLEQKNQQLLIDIETIIEQLKIKELEVEKLSKSRESLFMLKQCSSEPNFEETAMKDQEKENGLISQSQKRQKISKFSLGEFQKKILFSRLACFRSNRKIR